MRQHSKNKTKFYNIWMQKKKMQNQIVLKDCKFKYY